MRLRSLALLFVALPAAAQEGPDELFRAERNPIRAVFMMAYRTSLGVDQANVALVEANATLTEVAAGIAGVAEKVDALAESPHGGPISRCVERASAGITLCQGGQCQEIIQPCHPYGCNPHTGTCNSRCASVPDCAAGAECNSASQQCVVVGNTCADSFSVQQPAGNISSCMGYLCTAGACMSTCDRDIDCDAGNGYRCVDTRCRK
jgi:hypothetical protein